MSGRPTFDYVRAGDLIRVRLSYGAALYFGDSSIFPKLRTQVGNTFNLVRMDTAQTNWFGGGTVLIDLQPRIDFARLNDVVATVAGMAQNAGLSVDVPNTHGEFVAKVEETNGQVPLSIPAPGNSGGQSGFSFGGFLGGLTSSPVTLAVILVAVVILAKR